MIDIRKWLDAFMVKLDDTFGDRVWFLGLQGSYGRGEATDQSDIDVVVILDRVSVEDIDTYGTMLDGLPDRVAVCGFFSGKNEVLNWEPSDLFQFCHDTTPIKGSLDEVLSSVDESAVDRAIRLGACNIYHGCVHNMLHRKNEKILLGLYKSAYFVVQAITFKRTGGYIRYQKDLLPVVPADEKVLIQTLMDLRSGKAVDFDGAAQALFEWSKKWIGKQG